MNKNQGGVNGRIGALVFRRAVGPSTIEYREARAWFRGDRHMVLEQPTLKASVKRVRTGDGHIFLAEELRFNKVRLGPRVQYPLSGWYPVSGDFKSIGEVEAALWPHGGDEEARIVRDSA